MGTEQLKRLKELKKGSTRLRRMMADLSLDKAILAEGSKEKLLSFACRRQCVCMPARK